VSNFTSRFTFVAKTNVAHAKPIAKSLTLALRTGAIELKPKFEPPEASVQALEGFQRLNCSTKAQTDFNMQNLA